MGPLLIIGALLTASPATRLLYEEKCLYCHSSEVSERKRQSPARWAQSVERMRAKAPLLITRGDARRITQYIVQTLKLVPPPVKGPSVTVARAPVVTPDPRPDPRPEPEPDPERDELKVPQDLDDPPMPEPMKLTAADEELEQEGAALMQRRCSKCHTLNRVFNKLDSYDRSMATVRRMRLKTGSGITRADMDLIERFLKLDLETAAR